VIVTARDEAQARALFQERYRNTPSLLTRQIEQRVIGGNWGANGFTTMAQADILAGRAWWPRRPVGCRSEPAASMSSSTPTCCVDCGPSSPC
jgi:hypothetical protein